MSSGRNNRHNDEGVDNKLYCRPDKGTNIIQRNMPVADDAINEITSLGTSNNPPPLPARFRDQQSGYNMSRPTYNSYTPINYTYPPYNPPNVSPMYGYGGYNRFQPDLPTDRNSFVRLAEESSRPAFQSIESIVNAFSSVSMMLESTYQAVYSSFRAVIGVADNFSRLKHHLIGVLSALSFLRFLQYVCRRSLYFLGLWKPGSAQEAWIEVSGLASSEFAAQLADDSNKCNWPIVLFIGIILGAPWLVWKLISKFINNKIRAEWANGQDDHVVARAIYDFTARDSDEISLTSGRLINLAPKELQPAVKGWLLASADGETTGVIPADYVKILGRRRGKKQAQMPAYNRESEPPTSNKSDNTDSTRNCTHDAFAHEDKACSLNDIWSQERDENVERSLQE